MNQLIRPKTINFTELVKNSNTTLSLNLQTTMIKLLNEEFCEEEQKWYIANLFMFTNYHPTVDFPINLETVVKIVGFAHKKNAKRALENNFTEGEDYKVTVLPKEHGQFASEEIMLNMDTFKNLCMLVKTPEGKAIRKYYVKLENITNKIIQMEIEEQKQIQQNTLKLLEEKETLLQESSKLLIENRQSILLNSYHKKCIVYLIKIIINGIVLYKFGNSDNIKRRFSEHQREINQNIQLIYCIESKNNVLLETKLKQYLNQQKLKTEQIINGKNQTELINTDNIIIIQNKLVELNANIQEDIEILKCKEHILELKLQILKYKNNNGNDFKDENEDEAEMEREKNDCNIDSIDNMSLEELKAKLFLLEERKAKQREIHKKYMVKYRKSEKYKQRVTSDEYKQNRNKKYRENVTKDQKQKRKEHYHTTKQLKSDMLKSETEKNKFHNWLKVHVKQKNDSKIIWWDLLNKYLNHKTSDLISKIYKDHFMEYVLKWYPDITTKYNNHGYKYFSLH